MLNRSTLLNVVEILRMDFTERMQIITPFGFEATRDPRFLRYKVSRIHLYAKTDENLPRAQLEDELTRSIERNHGVLADSVGTGISWIIGSGGPKPIGPPGGAMVHLKMFDPQPLWRASLLDTYSLYFSLMPHLLTQGRLYESENFREFPSSRRFLFQVSRTWPHLYRDVPFGLPSSRHLRLAKSQAARDPFTAERPQLAATAEEWDLLNTEIKPYARAIAQVDADSSERAWAAETRDFYTGNPIRLKVHGDRPIRAAERIKNAYQTFGVVASSINAGSVNDC